MINQKINDYLIQSYRKTIGISLIIFSIAMIFGMLLMSFSNSLNLGVHYTSLIWFILIAGAAIISLLTFINSRILFILRNPDYVKEIKKDENKLYKIFAISVIVGVIIVVASLMLLDSYLESLFIILGFGDIFWILYMIPFILFKYHYSELSFGSMAYFFIFFITVISTFYTVNVYHFNHYYDIGLIYPSFSFAISIFTLIVICLFVGLLMIYRSSGIKRPNNLKYIIEKSIKSESRSKPKSKSLSNKNGRNIKKPKKRKSHKA